jgi:hypothetical protein
MSPEAKRRRRVSFAPALWGIGGKVDGMLPDGTVVEIKNRARHFFDRVPEYEMIQAECYIRIMDAPHCLHVQQLDGERRDTTVERNDKLWSTVILRNLPAFVSRLHQLVQDDELQDEWLTIDDDRRAQMYEDELDVGRTE